MRILLKNLQSGGEVKNRNAGVAEIVVEGHSGFGIKGEDVVCAGISAVIQTAVAGISGVASLPQSISRGEGSLRTEIHLSSAGAQELKAFQIIVKTMLLGLEEIGRAYPGSIEIFYE